MKSCRDEARRLPYGSICCLGQDIYEPLLICGIDGKDVYQHNHFYLTETNDVLH